MFDCLPYEVQCDLVNFAKGYSPTDIWGYVRDTELDPEWFGLPSEGPYSKKERAMGIDALITAFEFAHNVKISYWTRCDLVDLHC